MINPARQEAGAPDLRLQRHFPQLEFLDFAGRGLRQFGEHHVARAFVAGEVVAAPGDDVFGGKRRAGAKLDEGARGLAPFLVRLGDDRDGRDRGVLVDRVLDLDR